MAGFELQISTVGSDRSAKWAKTTAQLSNHSFYCINNATDFLNEKGLSFVCFQTVFYNNNTILQRIKNLVLGIRTHDLSNMSLLP